MACGLIRNAMLQAGLDPDCTPSLREIELGLTGFVDVRIAARRRGGPGRSGEGEHAYAKGEDLRQRLNARLDCIDWHYAETGTLPDFRTAPPMTLLGWRPRLSRSRATQARRA